MAVLTQCRSKHMSAPQLLPGVRPVDCTKARLERIMRAGNGLHIRTLYYNSHQGSGRVGISGSAADQPCHFTVMRDGEPREPSCQNIAPEPQPANYISRSVESTISVIRSTDKTNLSNPNAAVREIEMMGIQFQFEGRAHCEFDEHHPSLRGKNLSI